jgi:hypothetical protein
MAAAQGLGKGTASAVPTDQRKGMPLIQEALSHNSAIHKSQVCI